MLSLLLVTMTSIKRFKYRDEANDLIEVMDPSNIAGNLRISWTDAPDLTWHSQILRLVLPRHSQQHRFGQWYGNDYIQLTTVYHHLCSNNIKSTHHHHAACPVDIARASSMPVDFVIKVRLICGSSPLAKRLQWTWWLDCGLWMDQHVRCGQRTRDKWYIWCVCVSGGWSVCMRTLFIWNVVRPGNL